MGRRYASSPIVEAICEFHFEPDPAWDFTVLGLFYDKVRDQFPLRKQLTSTNTAFSGKVEAAEIDPLPLMQFLQSSGNTLLQVGQNLLTVNQLRPYTAWNGFQMAIQHGLQAYTEVAPQRPLQRVALRYINRIALKQGTKLADYFHFRPIFEQNHIEGFQSFIVGVQIPCQAAGGVASLQLGTIDIDDPEAIAFLIDINFVLSHPEELANDDVLDRIELAHEQIDDIFETCITDKLRQEFHEVR